jgi:large subunit ribosomal protein L49
MTASSAEEQAAGSASEAQFIPYTVRRTRTKNLPVYTDYKNGGTRFLTIVRNVDGDIQALMRELKELTGSEVTEAVGRIEVKGRHSAQIKGFLRDLGF